METRHRINSSSLPRMVGRKVSRYSKVERRMWGDEKFRALSPAPPNAQTLWVYLLTGPHNTSIPGLFVAGVGSLSDALRWPVDDTRRCLEEITKPSAKPSGKAKAMAKCDPTTGLVWLPNAIASNQPESPNVVIGWRSVWDLLPECRLRDEAESTLRTALAIISDSYAHAFDIATQRAEPSPRKEPKQNSEKPSAKANGKASAKASAKANGKAYPHPSPNPEPEPEVSEYPPKPPQGGAVDFVPTGPSPQTADPIPDVRPTGDDDASRRARRAYDDAHRMPDAEVAKFAREQREKLRARRVPT